MRDLLQECEHALTFKKKQYNSRGKRAKIIIMIVSTDTAKIKLTEVFLNS